MFSQNSVISLKRWLEFRGFQRKGTKQTCKKVRPAVGLNLLGSPAPGQAGGLCWSGGWHFQVTLVYPVQIASQSRTIHVSLTHVNYNLPGIKAGNGRVRGT